MKAVLRQKPDHAGALELLAEVYLAQGKRDRAAEQLAKLARQAAEQRDYARALGLYDRLLTLAPDHSQWLLERAGLLDTWGKTGNVRARQQAAEAFEALGDQCAEADPAKALELYVRAESCAPPTAKLLMKIARCRAKQDDLEGARHDLSRACDELVAVGELDAAVQNAKEIASLVPQDESLQKYLVDLLELIGRTDEAVETAMRLADEAAKRAQPEQVLEYLNRALSINPNYIPAIEALALHYHGTGDTASFCDVLVRLANANEQQGDLVGAVAALERLVDVRPDDVLVLERLAALHDKLGNIPKARACRRDLALIHHKRGAYESEREILLALREQDPEDEEILEALAECEFSLGNTEHACALSVELARTLARRGFSAQARTILEKAVQRDPDNVNANRDLFDLLSRLGAREEALERGLHLVELLQVYDQIDEAARVFEATVEIAPDDFELFRKYIYFLREYGRLEEATEKLLAMARRKRAAGEFEVAETALREIESLGAADVSVLEEFLLLYEQWGKVEDFAQRALEVARAYTTNGQDKKALTLLRRAVKVTNGHPAVRRELAEVYVSQGREGEALRELLQVAEALRLAGKQHEVIELLKRAAALAPKDVAIRMQLVDVLQSAGDRDAAALELEDLAAALMTEKDYSNALVALDRLVQDYPARLSARRVRADVYAALGKTAEAEQELNTFYLQSLLRQADDYHAKGDFTREAATLREAIKIVPEDEELLRRARSVELQAGELDAACATTLELAALIQRRGRGPEALHLLRETFEAAPTNIVLAEHLLEALIAGGEKEETIQHGERLAELLFAQGETDKAIGVFERLLTIAPDFEKFDERFAEFLERAGEKEAALARHLDAARRLAHREAWQQAEERLQEALRLDPECEDACEAMAEVAAYLGGTQAQAEWLARLARTAAQKSHYDKLLASLQKAVGIVPERVDLRQWLINVLEERGDAVGAVNELHALADLLIQRGEQAEALAAEERAVALAPNDPSARRRLAETLIMLNEVERGVDELEQVSQLYAQRGDFALALATLEEAQQLTPARLSVRKHKADIYERMGDLTRAEEERRQFEVARSVQEAQAARERGDLKAEKRALRKALDVAPQDEGVWRLLVRCHREMGDRRGEIQAQLQMAEAAYARQGARRARELLELALSETGREEAFLKRMFEIAQEMSDDAAVRDFGHQLVALYAEQSDGTQKGLEIYDSMLAYTPDDVELCLNVADYCARTARLGDALERLHRAADRLAEAGRYADAERLLLRGLELSPPSAPTLSRLVTVYERTGQTEEFEKRMLQLATALEENGELEQAIATARRLTLVSQENIPARQLLVRLLLAAGQTHAAIEEQLALVETLRHSGAFAQAVEAAREAVALSEGDERARRILAQCLLAAGDTEGANNELEELARQLMSGEKNTEALEVLDEILERSPDRLSCRVLRAELYAKVGRAEDALAEYRLISAAVASGVAMAQQAAASPVMPTLQIVPEYDFEHFVVGTNNNFAYATALAVARAPAQAYNPLFIYSDVGLGKTHLVNAIANYILRANPNVRIIYTNSEDFTAEVVEAIQTNTIHQFRARYKSVDLLIVDDVQFLAGKERAQEEFFHIFNALFQAKKQIVITSDRPPKDIARLENRLLSRFGAGVIVDIAPPDFETRVAILNREIERGGLPIGPEIVQLVAETIVSNVRELKGALNQIMAMHTIQGKEISVENVRAMLESLYGRPPQSEEAPAPPSREKRKK